MMSDPSPVCKSVSWGPDSDDIDPGQPRRSRKMQRGTFGCLGLSFANVYRTKKRKDPSNQPFDSHDLDLVDTTLNDLELQGPEVEDDRKSKEMDAATADETRSAAESSYYSSFSSSRLESLDNKKVFRGKLFMYLALLTAATVISVSAYVCATRAQQNEMTSKVSEPT